MVRQIRKSSTEPGENLLSTHRLIINTTRVHVKCELHLELPFRKQRGYPFQYVLFIDVDLDYLKK